MNTETNLIPHSTMQSIVNNWAVIQEKLRASAESLRGIDEHLKLVFDTGVSLSYDVKFDAEKEIEQLRRSIWSHLIQKTELRRFMSVQRQKEIDKNISSGQVEEISMESILALFRSASANLPQMMEETIAEVFEMLRPHNSNYRNNEKFAGELGKKVIFYCIEKGWGKEKYRVAYHYDDKIRAINNAFYLLDGRGHGETYYGELYDAIKESPDGKGETDYFRFKCYDNGNLHLEFKRLDLVKKMNGIVAGNVLRKAV